MDKNKEYRSELYTNIFDDTPYGIMILDDRVVIDLNDQAVKMLGYKNKSDLLGLTPTEISPKFQMNGITSAEMAKINFGKAIKDGHYEFDWVHEKKNGEILLIHVVLKRLGQYKSVFVGYWQDITEQKKVENRFRNFMENFPGGVYIKNDKFEYTYMNKRALENLKGDYNLSQIVNKGLKAEDLYDEEVAEFFEETDQKLIENRKLREDVIHYGTDDEKKWLRSLKFVYKDADYLDYIGGISVDITELIEAKQNTEKVMESLLTTIQSLTESRDPFTAGHELRVSSLSVEVGTKLGLEENKLEGLRIASLLHDVGKIYIPLELLSKPGRLNDKQFNIVKEHTRIGAELLTNVTFEHPIGDIIRQHHELQDGTGYPSGLKGDQIMIEAKIIRVADVIEAMSHHRPYRPRLTNEQVVEELNRNKSIKYDSSVVDVCLEIMNDNLHELKGWDK